MWWRLQQRRNAKPKVTSPGLEFFYEYDFGTAIELGLKVVSERRANWTRRLGSCQKQTSSDSL